MSPVPKPFRDTATDLATALDAAQRQATHLLTENAKLSRRISGLEAAGLIGQEARRAALNLMEDAVESRRRAEELNAELKRVAEALREADRRKTDFLAILGHELRNPLAAIKGGLTLFQSEKARPESRAAALPVVVQQVSHMERLIDDVLDIARIERGRLQVRREKVELVAMLRGAAEMVTGVAAEKHCELQLQLPPPPIELFGDAVRLTQVFVNLLINALKFSPDGGRIELDASVTRDTARVRVRDHGAGIQADLLPHIFEPFVQSQRSLQIPEAGLGLGLAISRQLVELHGGTIEAHSDGENCGSEFVIHLPLGLDAP